MKHSKQIFGAVLACILASSQAIADEQIFNIRDQGAIPDGKTRCTTAIQRAIDECAASGGGTVYFPPGTWLSGTIELRSHITLKLDAGCRSFLADGSEFRQNHPARIVVSYEGSGRQFLGVEFNPLGGY